MTVPKNDVKIGAVSLGCSKNRVDTELMLGRLTEAGYSLTGDPSKADVIIVNTCGFIDDAKEESINTILEMAQYKNTGSLKALVVTGCLSGRYKGDLSKLLPEVDAFLGITAQNSICETVEKALEGKKTESYGEADIKGDYSGRVLTTPPHYAYIKIAEGCNRRCAYCAIPFIRGNLRSRDMEEIVTEAMTLVKRGVKELILVAQDTSKYGLDLYGKPMITELLKQLDSIEGVRMIRLLYCYPDGVTDELLDTINGSERIADYMDIPIQHTSTSVLRRMNRADDRDSIFAAIKKIRDRNPDFIIRSTVITGFPGETEEEFREMLEDIEKLEFDRLGCFAFSREEGTKAYSMEDQIPEEIREERKDEVMFLQQGISNRRNRRRIGKIYNVVVEDYLEDEDIYLARSFGETPEVDGSIAVKSSRPLEISGYYDVKILRADDYELLGEVVDE